MSYCRWSTDNFQCDLYCYEDVSGGWTTHVAGQRRTGFKPSVDPYSAESLNKLSDPANYDQWKEDYETYHAELDKCTFENIGLPYDGHRFNDETLEEFRDRIVMLIEAGYNVPSYLLDTIDEEITEAEIATTH